MEAFVEALEKANYFVVMTGAGMDTESNLPDFRGANGLWKNHDSRLLASTEALANNYDLFHEFYSHRIKALDTVKPHVGHEILAQWERSGKLKCIITQNVSGLHRAAGSQNVLELHGNIRDIYCNDCHQTASKEDFYNKASCSCGGKLRPGVVLFGEMLPQDVFSQALEELSRADLLIILGTSLEVYPAAELPFIYPMIRCYVDLTGRTDRRIDYLFREKAGDFLAQVQALIQW